MKNASPLSDAPAKCASLFRIQHERLSGCGTNLWCYQTHHSSPACLRSTSEVRAVGCLRAGALILLLQQRLEAFGTEQEFIRSFQLLLALLPQGSQPVLQLHNRLLHFR